MKSNKSDSIDLIIERLEEGVAKGYLELSDFDGLKLYSAQILEFSIFIGDDDLYQLMCDLKPFFNNYYESK